MIATISEVISIGSSLASFDSTGSIINFSQIVKTLVKFRYVDVYYGELLEGYLKNYGRSLELEDKEEFNENIMNQVGERGKYSLYKRPIVTIKNLVLKVVPYLFSWVLKIWKFIHLRKSRIAHKSKIGKVAFYLIFAHNAIHFSIFNIFLSSGVMLIVRTILHMKLNPETPFLKFDKVIAYICLLFCILDFLELIYTATKYSRREKEKEEKENTD